jgi:Tfp pilus assembly protein FimT
MGKNGFSLLEILFVLCISVITIGLALPAYHYFNDRAARQANSLQLLHAINFARTEAITLNTPIILCKSRDQLTCGGEWQEGYIVIANKKVIFKFKSMVKGTLHWRAYPIQKDFLEFSPLGFTQQANGTFWYCAIHQENPLWALVMSQSGRARLVYPDGAGKIIDDKGKSLVC